MLCKVDGSIIYGKQPVHATAELLHQLLDDIGTTPLTQILNGDFGVDAQLHGNQERTIGFARDNVRRPVNAFGVCLFVAHATDLLVIEIRLFKLGGFAFHLETTIDDSPSKCSSK